MHFWGLPLSRPPLSDLFWGSPATPMPSLDGALPLPSIPPSGSGCKVGPSTQAFIDSRMPIQPDFQEIFEGLLEVFVFFEEIMILLKDEEERLQVQRQLLF